tara:strand:+ start:1379 stop:2128 length:750 start_codon:yes stop_codon:yes gene_type:complete
LLHDHGRVLFNGTPLGQQVWRQIQCQEPVQNVEYEMIAMAVGRKLLSNANNKGNVGLNIKGDMKPIIKHLNSVQRKQIPFATANAINTTLFDIMRIEKKQMELKLDRPTNFTLKGFRINKAKKTQLRGDISIAPDRYKYLQFQIEGGTRNRTNIPVPTRQAKLNKHGNIGGKGKNRLIKKKNQYIGNINGTDGVWERTRAGKSKLIIAFKQSVKYKKKFPFYKIADGVARKKFQRNLSISLKRALRTAR